MSGTNKQHGTRPRGRERAGASHLRAVPDVGRTGAHFPSGELEAHGAAELEGDELFIRKAAERAQLYDQIWQAAADVQIRRKRSDGQGFEWVEIDLDIMRNMVGVRFEVDDGLDSLSHNHLEQVRDGLIARAEAQVKARRISGAVDAVSLSDFLAFAFDSRDILDLSSDELNVVETEFAAEIAGAA